MQCMQFSWLSGSWKAMAGRMSIRRCLKLIDGPPDPKGPLSTTIPSAAIASDNREDRYLAEFGGHTPRYCTAYRRGNLSHSKPAIALSSMLTARSLNERTIYGACIIKYRVKLFSLNFFTHFFYTNIFSMEITRRKLSELLYIDKNVERTSTARARVPRFPRARYRVTFQESCS